jgi:hypothetical protein
MLSRNCAYLVFACKTLFFIDFHAVVDSPALQLPLAIAVESIGRCGKALPLFCRCNEGRPYKERFLSVFAALRVGMGLA